MKAFLLSIILCICALSSNAQEPTFESMKAQLSEKSLPLVNLTVDIDQVSKSVYTDARMEIADPLKRTDQERVTTTFTCRVKYRGSHALKYDKKSFAIKLTDDEGEEKNAGLFGIRKDDSWILDAMAIDRIRMRNRVNFDIWNEMSSTPYPTDNDRRNGTEGLFVELFINGNYHGLYCFSDKVNRKLLGIKKPETEEGDRFTIRGVIYKGKSWSSATYLKSYRDDSMYETTWNGWELSYPDSHPCPDAYMPLKEFIDYCARTTDAELKKGIDERFYWQNFVDYHVFLLAEGLRDNQMKNTFLSIVNTRKGRCMMVTPWDLDCSLGGNYNGKYHDEMSRMEDVLEVFLYYRLWNDDICHYRKAVTERWRELYATVLSEEAFNARVDAYARAFMESGAWDREYRKWNGNPVELHQDIHDETAYVKDWYRRNCLHLNNDIFYDIASGISRVNAESATDHEAAYDLMGRKVNGTYKGIVIQGGRILLKK